MAQQPAGAVQAGFHRLRVDRQLGGGFLHRALLHVAHHVDGAERRRQGVDGVFQQVADLRARGGYGRVFAAEARGELDDLVGIHGGLVDFLQPDHVVPLAQPATGLVQHDGGEPGQQAGLATEGIQLAVRAQVGLLQRVLGLGILAQHAAGDAEQSLVAALHDVAERALLTTTHQGHQRGIVQRGVVNGNGMKGSGHDFSFLHRLGCDDPAAGSR